ncbi:MAG: CoA-binding protein [Anaerolineae bacterium]|nr:CoA-binding protein [Anaerolineae bacterium]
MSLNTMTADFLAQKRIAVAGVSRTEQDSANAIYKKLRGSGYTVFPINPHAEVVEGDPCYPNLKSIPGGVDGVVIVTKPEVTEQIVRECAEVGVPRVWIHKGMGNSVSDEAVQFCRDHNIQVIPGACPMMYCEPVDMAHKCFRWFWGVTGRLPK